MGKAWILLALVAACGTGDDTLEGSRGSCAYGGVTQPCDDEFARTPEAACSRLVECGAIPLDLPEDYQFDYGNCVVALERASAGTTRTIAACIANSKCDQLLPMNPQNPNPDEIACLHFGTE